MKNLELMIPRIGQWGQLWIKTYTLKQQLEIILDLAHMSSSNNLILKENIFQLSIIAQVQKYGIHLVPSVSINQLPMLQDQVTIIPNTMIYLILENMCYQLLKEMEREDLLDHLEILLWTSQVNKLKVIWNIFSSWPWKI